MGLIGLLIAIATFPGIICHEIAHKFFCDLAGVPVYAVRYLRVGRLAGYVVHAPVDNPRVQFLISVGPLIVNTLLCSVITFAAVIPIFILEVADSSVASWILLWVGLSIGTHAFPSHSDMHAFRASVQRRGTGGTAHFVGNLLSPLFRIANILGAVGFNVLYAVLVASVGPRLLLGLWPVR